ncbi:MAG: phosphoenolpyruvate-utilizing N-terminal domain-containing protein [Thermodesulfobacteriota bacterium]|nr:phosphoenolpyruvate-utilizing N-terminal domain-containing protein [Thermodesulfobacteriota bacterium]
MKGHVASEPRRLRGIGVSPGIIIGKARLIDRSRVKILYQYLIDDDRTGQEVDRFKDALRAAEEKLVTLKDRMTDQVKAQSFILDSHLMILKDSMLGDSTIQRILNEKINAEWALKKSLEDIRQVFEQIDDEYISTRISDVENVVERVLRHLSGETHEGLTEIDERVIIVAHDLSPADTTELNINKVMGFITDVGGRTSHTAIMAQALELPAVMGLKCASELVNEGVLLIVDGHSGEVVVNPDDSAIINYQERQLRHEKYKSGIALTSHLPAETLDGHRIAINANIEFLGEVEVVRDYGWEGIGLYRTEFLYLKGLPDEEDLFEDYKEVAQVVAPDPVTIRTLDLGGDKLASGIDKARHAGMAYYAILLELRRALRKQQELYQLAHSGIDWKSRLGRQHQTLYYLGELAGEIMRTA